jgi:hypothetical protein
MNRCLRRTEYLLQNSRCQKATVERRPWTRPGNQTEALLNRSLVERKRAHPPPLRLGARCLPNRTRLPQHRPSPAPRKGGFHRLPCPWPGRSAVDYRRQGTPSRPRRAIRRFDTRTWLCPDVSLVRQDLKSTPACPVTLLRREASWSLCSWLQRRTHQCLASRRQRGLRRRFSLCYDREPIDR